MADQAIVEGRKIIPSYAVIDMAFAYKYSDKGRAFLRVNNILDNTYLVSYRPFGARPGAPRTIMAGFNQNF
jgi:Fe(3+) dicitrate transport protein